MAKERALTRTELKFRANRISADFWRKIEQN